VKTGRPIPNPAANYTGEPRLVFPSAHGGHNWQGMAFDPRRKLVYIPARDSGFIYSVSGPTWYEHARDFPKPAERDRTQKAHGALLAWDPIRGKPAWQVVLDTLNNSGVLATAGGLVVHGTQDGYLRFYSADDGRMLHQVFTGTGIVAPPITYEVNGVQYFAFQAGWSGYNSDPAPIDAPPPYLNDARLVVLKLGGTAVPVAARAQRPPFLAVDAQQDAKVVMQGAGLYLTYCALCHGHIGEDTLVPDLRRMSQGTYGSFDAIVRGGLLKGNGMASFADVLQPADVAAIRAFIVDWAQRSRRNEPSARQLPRVSGGSDAPRQPGH
jgi:mono/diheme cytochrome c family protein